MSFTVRGTPIPAADGGFQVVSLDVSDGPLQLADLFAVPVQANSAWLQCTTGTGFEQRLDGDPGSGAGWQFMPLYSYFPVENKQQLQSLVLQSPTGTVTLAIMFFEGSNGPIPKMPVVELTGGSPGPPPPPPPGGANLPTQNVCHVMKNGNPATATRNRMDLPFLTCAAAEAAAQPGDTIMVWQGTYDENDLGNKRLFYILLGSTLNSTTSKLFNTVEDVNVSGFGLLQGSSGTDLITINNGRTFTSHSVDIQSDATAVLIAEGNFIHVGDIRATSAAITVSGTATVNVWGDLTGDSGDAAIFNEGVLNGFVHGHIVGADSSGVSMVAGNFKVYGSINAANNAVACYDSAEFTVYGSVNGERGIFTTDEHVGRIAVYGNVYGQTGGVAIQGGYCHVYGNVEAASGLGTEVSNFAELFVSGDVITQEGPAACKTSTGTTKVLGDVINNSLGNGVWNVNGTTQVTGEVANNADAPALLVQAGNVQVRGNITAADPGGTGVRVSGASVVNVMGDIESAGDGWNQTGGNHVHFGNMVSTGISYAVSSGSLIHFGQSNSSNDYALRVTGGSVANTGKLIGAGVAAFRIDAGTIEQYGDISAPVSGAGMIMTGGSGRIYGNVSSAANQGVQCSGGTRLQVYGDVSGGLNGFRANLVGVGLFVDVYGSCTGASSGVSIQDSTPLVATFHGRIIGLTGPGASLGPALVYIKDLVTSSGANQPGINILATTANIRLMASARIERTGTAASITGPAASPVTSFGASINAAVAGTVNVTGPLPVIP